jgi:putative nucleotidyltransferase with HDIG domain
LIVNVLATVAMSRLRERSHLFYAGAFVMGAMGVVAFGATLASTSVLGDSLVAGGYGLVGGLLAAVLTYGLLPFFEVVFRVTTDVRLLELANPSHPLLRRLMMEAPGTYNHSVLTANLAEAAAEDIGANPLLARVGAYYHDIGKIRRPMFFVENQLGRENPHDDTSPNLSSLIITSHVKEGLELAKQHRLPEEIRDIIAQHHGTSLVSYFYDKASKSGSDVAEEDFRYPGLRPTRPEAALIMLADSAEAVGRTVQNPTVERMEQVVRKVAREKLEDGQFDEARLTMADIDTIVKRYANMLAGVYHKRIEYPGNDRASKDAGKAAARMTEAGEATAAKASERGPAAEDGSDTAAVDEES